MAHWSSFIDMLLLSKRWCSSSLFVYFKGFSFFDCRKLPYSYLWQIYNHLYKDQFVDFPIPRPWGGRWTGGPRCRPIWVGAEAAKNVGIFARKIVIWIGYIWDVHKQ
jgi:hypothetical protein